MTTDLAISLTGTILLLGAILTAVARAVALDRRP